MQSRAKNFVINHLLDLVSTHIPLEQAHVLLLGGMGIETKICLERGIEERHINIIERRPSRMRVLMRHYPRAFTYQGNLNNADNMLRAMHGRGASIDYMHLDLCGTLDPVCQVLRSLMKISAKSEGHCIAITTADQRVHQAICDPQTTLDESKELFDPYADYIWTSLMSLHNFVRASWSGTEADPNKVALRELNIYNHIAKACGFDHSAVTTWPESMVRIIFSASGFRMRTYFFHIHGDRLGISQHQARKQFAKLIHNAPCFYLINEQLVKVPQPTPEESSMDREQELSELRRELETVMSIVSKDKRSKIERLFVLAEGVTSPLEVISMIEAAVQGVKNELTGSANTSEAPSPVSEREPDSRQPSVPPPPPPPPPQAQQSEQASEPPESFVFVPVPIPEKMKLKDTARYLLLEAGREADAGERELALIRAQEKAYKKLGIEGEDNCGDQLRGIYARSQGKFRAEFVARQLLQFPEGAKRERALKKLARCYGEIPEVLLTEAQAHKSWKKAYGLL